MTQYIAYSEWEGAGMALKAGTYEIKIVRVEVVNVDTSATWVYFQRHSGSTLSGGSAVSIYPMRHASPTSTASARAGDGLSFSGSEERFTEVIVGGAPFTTPSGNHTGSGNLTFEPPLDLTIAPGTVFEVDGLDDEKKVTIYFEELRLSQSY